jgi:germination protein M
MAQSGKRRRTSIGFLFWIAFILLIVVIFLANRSNIEQVVENTGILEVLRERGAGSDSREPAEEPEETEREPLVLFDTPERDNRPPAPQSEPQPVPQPQPAPTPAPDRELIEEEEPAPEQTPEIVQRSPSPDPSRPNRRMANLYYIKVTDTGRTFPQKVTRPVYYSSSPLTETIGALIAGPTASELESGLLNLIPEGTQLISASVREGVAYLSFNQAFRFNSLGAEGTVAQLLQIIYSSTEFSTVDRVQFLIDGERLNYLSGDGIFVGEPLGRDAFSS